MFLQRFHEIEQLETFLNTFTSRLETYDSQLATDLFWAADFVLSVKIVNHWSTGQKTKMKIIYLFSLEKQTERRETKPETVVAFIGFIALKGKE